MQVGSWISYIIVPPYQQNRLSVTPNVLPLSSPALLLLAPPPAFQLPQLDRHHYITRTRAVMPPASSSSLLTSISSHTAAGAPEPQCRRLSQFPSHRTQTTDIYIYRERERDRIRMAREAACCSAVSMALTARVLLVLAATFTGKQAYIYLYILHTARGRRELCILAICNTV